MAQETIGDWIDSLDKNRKGFKKFADLLIDGDEAEFERNQTFATISKLGRDRIESIFKDVKGVSGLLAELIEKLDPFWKNEQTSMFRIVSLFAVLFSQLCVSFCICVCDLCMYVCLCLFLCELI